MGITVNTKDGLCSAAASQHGLPAPRRLNSEVVDASWLAPEVDTDSGDADRPSIRGVFS